MNWHYSGGCSCRTLMLNFTQTVECLSKCRQNMGCKALQSVCMLRTNIVEMLVQ